MICVYSLVLQGVAVYSLKEPDSEQIPGVFLDMAVYSLKVPNVEPLPHEGFLRVRGVVGPFLCCFPLISAKDIWRTGSCQPGFSTYAGM